MTSTTDPEYTPTYTLDNAWRAARERLTLLEAACDPITEQHLDKVGIRPGWRCLEVGAGAGSVVRMLCDRVGAEGRVLAVDLEPALLADLSAPNLEVRRLDVVADELPEAAFDLVHTRAVLMHIPQRDDVLPKLVRALRPGGTLLLEEVDMRCAFEPDDIFRRSLDAMYRPILEANAGMDLFWAGTLPDLLGPAGLVDVQSTRNRMTFTGGSVLAEFFRVTWLQYLESQPYTDAERAILEECRAALLEPGGSYTAWDVVAAWARRP
ncbi:MAG: methyltransferase domain-containing protein [Actinomycetota bacterium]|jgi:SAM-dependent methyltransferase